MRPTSFKFSRSPLALLAALVCASTPFLAYAGDGGASPVYEFRQTVPSLVVSDGVAPVGSLSLSTSAINFGSVATHTSETRQVLLSNDGTGVVSFIADPVVTGAAFATGATSCASSLAVNADCLTEVTFSPTTVGDFSGALTFSTDLVNSPHVMSLAGTAFNPVSLTAATLPDATVNSNYAPFNFSSLLAASNEPTPDLEQVVWGVEGAMPAGMAFDAGTATLSGTPTALTAPEGASFTVTAAYKSNEGRQAYTIAVNGATLRVISVVAGNSHTCALTTSRGVKCWGYDGYGQLGDGAGVAHSSSPVDVQGLTSGVASIAAGVNHTCAVMSSGGLKCWGYDAAGQLGNDSSLITQFTPVDVLGMTTGVASVSAGGSHTCAVTTAGALKCWGAGNVGQLGYDGSGINRPTPMNVQGLGALAASVSAGRDHTCAVTTVGGLKCWGSDSHGQLGNDAALANQPNPVSVSGMTAGVGQVVTGALHTCAVTMTGGMKCWGWDGTGVLGDDAALVNKPTPVAVAGLTVGVLSAAVGTAHSCALATGGGVKCWGNDENGQLGNDAALVNRPTPVTVEGLTSGVSSVSAGANHTCAVMAGGAVKCWGFNASGQLGDGALVNRATPGDVVP